VASCWGGLWEAGVEDQVTVLADRAAAHLPLDDPAATASLLGSLRAAGARAHVTLLDGAGRRSHPHMG